MYRSKSLVGSAAFVIVGLLVCLAYLTLVGRPSAPADRLAAAAAIVLAGALAELLGERLDDNITVPAVCALAAHVAF